ncbi:hypothetical protein Hypma_002028 [Hypsizygus marmoreus]|uniref:ATP-dependent DNA helicase n=1 Tax=Hypsizygus marmoreus TaxID=39966 RepID=A0A369J6L4_HYPMA|nr:hypothetical protein Hypma_002028 [Hypsizygus marmoreus]
MITKHDVERAMENSWPAREAQFREVALSIAEDVGIFKSQEAPMPPQVSAIVANREDFEQFKLWESFVQGISWKAKHEPADLLAPPSTPQSHCRAHDIIVTHLDQSLQSLQPEQLLMVVQGPGGTGKSMLISKITETFRSRGCDYMPAKTATTGVAASLIEGQILHSWASILQGGRLKSLGKATHEKRAKNIGQTWYLIIDKFSMLMKEILCMLSQILEDFITASRAAPSIEQRCEIAALWPKSTGELSADIHIAMGMRIMVTQNVAMEADLANGTWATIESIVLDSRNSDTPDDPNLGVMTLCHPPAMVLIRPVHVTFPQIPGLPPEVILLFPSKANFVLKSARMGDLKLTCCQLPITGAYAFMDYKLQGQTLEYVIVDLACPPIGALSLFNAYVALSRSRGRDTIQLLQEFDENLFTTHPVAFLEDEDEHLSDLNVKTCRAHERNAGIEPHVSTPLIVRLLNRDFSEKECIQFRWLQSETGMLISGSTTIKFFNGACYPGSDLDFNNIANALALSMEQENPSSEPHYQTEGIMNMYSAIEVIVNFYSTCVMNFITYNNAYSLFPYATFMQHRSLARPMTAPVELATKQKYEGRGWKYEDLDDEDAVRSVPDLGDCCRQVGDEQTWTIALEPALSFCGDDITSNKWFHTRTWSNKLEMQYGQYNSPLLQYKYI